MFDYKHTENGDIDLSGGDLTLTEPTGQHKRDILIAAQGHYRETPEIGVDAAKFLLDDEPDDFLRTVRKHCVKDGMTVSDVYMGKQGDLNIEAEYENN